MNEERFDDLTKALAAPVSRGRMLKMVGGALLCGWGLVLGADDAKAKKKKKKKKRRLAPLRLLRLLRLNLRLLRLNLPLGPWSALLRGKGRA